MSLTDRELERLAPRLGGRAADAIDVERVASRVATRLRSAGAPVRPQPAGRWLALAAGVALMIGGGLLTFGTEGKPPDTTHPVAVSTPGLHDLSAAELSQVLDSLAAADPVVVDGQPTLEDLNAEQLRRLLSMMEG